MFYQSILEQIRVKQHAISNRTRNYILIKCWTNECSIIHGYNILEYQTELDYKILMKGSIHGCSIMGRDYQRLLIDGLVYVKVEIGIR